MPCARLLLPTAPAPSLSLTSLWLSPLQSLTACRARLPVTQDHLPPQGPSLSPPQNFVEIRSHLQDLGIRMWMTWGGGGRWHFSYDKLGSGLSPQRAGQKVLGQRWRAGASVALAGPCVHRAPLRSHGPLSTLCCRPRGRCFSLYGDLSSELSVMWGPLCPAMEEGRVARGERHPRARGQVAPASPARGAKRSSRLVAGKHNNHSRRPRAWSEQRDRLPKAALAAPMRCRQTRH